MIQHAWMLCAASVLASAGAAHAADATQPSATRSFVVSGEVLIYAPSVSGLPQSTLIAPRGARIDDNITLKVESQADVATDADGIARFDSAPLVHGRTPLVLGGDTAGAFDIGDLVLQSGSDGWTFYAQDGDATGRPMYSISPESLSIKSLSADQFVVSGELVLHEEMLEELGLRGAQRPPSTVAGAVTLMASTYPGVAATIVSPALRWQPHIQSSPLTVAGPDVIVSTVGSPITKWGTVGGITAYTTQTVSCNIGTQDAEWLANSAHHPVIGSQVYRFETVNGASRFEEIGISWLKHGFCAADAPSCPGGTYHANNSCDFLGEFATDTYNSQRNGQQTNLGPRSEVNPWTGAYPYPFILGAGVSGNAINKRNQIQNTDLNPALNPGAQYIDEVVYICTSEPTANRYNNYSNRSLSIGAPDANGGYTITHTGGTNSQQAAIQRWPLLDAGVTLVTVDVPNDGRFYVGGKATSIGGGLWHYEYAIFNMNCHDSARLVQVPTNASVSVSNIGFHDINYHSSEVYNGTDWPGAVVGSNVEWSTSTFASNPNANALRWSTLYNFRFDADAPPVTGDLALGLFRSGGSATASGLPVPGNGGPSSFAYCFGDGSGTACPCGNNSVAGNNEGCQNSLGTGGLLTISGTPSVSADSLVLLGNGMPDSSALYFQGVTKTNGGSGAAFGDGLRCASGSVVRLGTETNVLGLSSYPDASGTPISIKGNVTPGLRYYQIWYRNAATFCSADTFNLTNGYQVVWQP